MRIKIFLWSGLLFFSVQSVMGLAPKSLLPTQKKIKNECVFLKMPLHQLVSNIMVRGDLNTEGLTSDSAEQLKEGVDPVRAEHFLKVITDLKNNQKESRDTLLELVANGLDASKSLTDFQLVIDTQSELQTFIVEDFGMGMSLQDIVFYLLAPLKSSKKDQDTIGRFGRGFFSALFWLKNPGDSIEIITQKQGQPIFKVKLQMEEDTIFVGLETGDAVSGGSGTRIIVRSQSLNEQAIADVRQNISQAFEHYSDEANIVMDGQRVNPSKGEFWNSLNSPRGSMVWKKGEQSPEKGRVVLAVGGVMIGKPIFVEGSNLVSDLVLHFPADTPLTEDRKTFYFQHLRTMSVMEELVQTLCRNSELDKPTKAALMNTLLPLLGPRYFGMEKILEDMRAIFNDNDLDLCPDLFEATSLEPSSARIILAPQLIPASYAPPGFLYKDTEICIVYRPLKDGELWTIFPRLGPNEESWVVLHEDFENMGHTARMLLLRSIETMSKEWADHAVRLSLAIRHLQNEGESHALKKVEKAEGLSKIQEWKTMIDSVSPEVVKLYGSTRELSEEEKISLASDADAFFDMLDPQGKISGDDRKAFIKDVMAPYVEVQIEGWEKNKQMALRECVESLKKWSEEEVRSLVHDLESFFVDSEDPVRSIGYLIDHYMNVLTNFSFYQKYRTELSLKQRKRILENNFCDFYLEATEAYRNHYGSFKSSQWDIWISSFKLIHSTDDNLNLIQNFVDTETDIDVVAMYEKIPYKALNYRRSLLELHSRYFPQLRQYNLPQKDGIIIFKLFLEACVTESSDIMDDEIYRKEESRYLGLLTYLVNLSKTEQGRSRLHIYDDNTKEGALPKSHRLVHILRSQIHFGTNSEAVAPLSEAVEMNPLENYPPLKNLWGAAASEAIGSAMQQNLTPGSWVSELLKNAAEAGAKNCYVKIFQEPWSSNEAGEDGLRSVVVFKDDGKGLAHIEDLLIPNKTSKIARGENPNFGQGFFMLFSEYDDVSVVSYDGQYRRTIYLRKTSPSRLSYHVVEEKDSTHASGTTVYLRKNEPSQGFHPTALHMLLQDYGSCVDPERMKIIFEQPESSQVINEHAHHALQWNFTPKDQRNGASMGIFFAEQSSLFRDGFRVGSLPERYWQKVSASLRDQLKKSGLTLNLNLPSFITRLRSSGELDDSLYLEDIQNAMYYGAIALLKQSYAEKPAAYVQHKAFPAIPYDFFYEFNNDTTLDSMKEKADFYPDFRDETKLQEDIANGNVHASFWQDPVQVAYAFLNLLPVNAEKESLVHIKKKIQEDFISKKILDENMRYTPGACQEIKNVETIVAPASLALMFMQEVTKNLNATQVARSPLARRSYFPKALLGELPPDIFADYKAPLTLVQKLSEDFLQRLCPEQAITIYFYHKDDGALAYSNYEEKFIAFNLNGSLLSRYQELERKGFSLEAMVDFITMLHDTLAHEMTHIFERDTGHSHTAQFFMKQRERWNALLTPDQLKESIRILKRYIGEYLFFELYKTKPAVVEDWARKNAVAVAA